MTDARLLPWSFAFPRTIAPLLGAIVLLGAAPFLRAVDTDDDGIDDQEEQVDLWTAPDGALGSQNGIYFHDADQDGSWSLNEDIWQDDVALGTPGIYDADIDKIVYTGPDGWQTADQAVGFNTSNRGGVYYADGGDNWWQAGENLWQEVDVNGLYDADFDVRIMRDTFAPGDPLSPLVWRSLSFPGGNAGQVATVPGDARFATGGAGYTDWTVESWFKLSSNANDTGALIKRHDNAGKTAFELGLLDGRPYARVTGLTINPADPDPVYEIVASRAPQLRDSSPWVHLAAQWEYNSHSLRLFINGVWAGGQMVRSPDVVRGSGAGWTTELMGDRGGEYLKGNLDEVRIWTNVGATRRGLRSQHQIREYMTRPLPLVGAGADDFMNTPSAYYRFDDGGTTAQDYSRDYNEYAGPYVLPLPAGVRFDSATAVALTGKGNTEYDPIPDGWQQLHFNHTDSRVGGTYDWNWSWMNQATVYYRDVAFTYMGETELETIGMYSPWQFQQNPDGTTTVLYGQPWLTFMDQINSGAQPFYLSGSTYLDPHTDETIPSRSFSGSPYDARVFFTDLFLESDQVESAILDVYLGQGGADFNHMRVWLNGERVGGLNTAVSVPHDWQFDTDGDAIRETLDLMNAPNGTLRPGRNRITIYTAHKDTSDPIQPLTFWGETKVNGYRNANGNGNNLWFQTQIPGIGISDTDDTDAISAAIDWTPNASSIGILVRENAEVIHAYREDGVPIRHFATEAGYGIAKWAYDQDPDGDGLTNWHEFFANTNPLDDDTDGDGIPDGELDSDGDGLINVIEATAGTYPYSMLNTHDTDDDGISDYDEVVSLSDPTNSRSPAAKRFLSLDGDDYLVIPEVDSSYNDESALRDWTVELWVRPEIGELDAVLVRRTMGRYAKLSPPTDTAYPNESDDFYYATNFDLGITGGKAYVGFKTASGAAWVAEGLHDVRADGKTWTHVAGSFSRSERTLRLYVNGQLSSIQRGITDRPPTMLQGLNGITVGSGLPENGSVAYSSFAGGIDELAIWEDVRTEAEISANQSDGITSIVPGTPRTQSASYWVMMPYFNLWAEDNNLVNLFLFDDGGEYYEDFSRRMDWLAGWSHSIIAAGTLAETGGPFYEAATGVEDSDNDGLPDDWEIQYFGSITVTDGTGDWDGDGLNDYYEYLSGLDPTRIRTYDTGPSDPYRDEDLDGLTNIREQQYSTMPRMIDTDDDGLTDGEEITGVDDYMLLDNGINPSAWPLATDGTTDPLSSLDPEIERCLGFNGVNQYLEIPKGDTQALATWTASIWIQPDAAENDGAVLIQRIADSGNVNYELGLQKVGTELKPYARFQTNSDVEYRVGGDETHVAGIHEISTGTAQSVRTGMWSHVAAVWDDEADALSLYVNGRRASVRMNIFADEGVGLDLGGYVSVAGQAGAGTDRFFAGKAREIKLLGEALSASQILQQYYGDSPDGLADQPTAGPALSELDAEEKSSVEARLDLAAQVAAAGGATYTVGYSPVMLRPLSQLTGRLPITAEAARSVSTSSSFESAIAKAAVPESFDWRDQNGVTSVKDQGAYGACYAFTTTGSAEAVLRIRTGIQADLSEQFVVSGSGFGEGGWECHYLYDGSNFRSPPDVQLPPPPNAKAPDGRIGAVLEADFPYAEGWAEFEGPYPRAYVYENWGYVTGLQADEDLIKQAVYTYGPLSTGVFVGEEFQAYESGIFNTDEAPDAINQNHAVLIVGWGTDETDGDYWIIKNSWGATWGENGYMRIAPGTSNIGQITTFVEYAATGGLMVDLSGMDGGVTVENYAFQQDWLENWKHAGIPRGFADPRTVFVDMNSAPSIPTVTISPKSATGETPRDALLRASVAQGGIDPEGDETSVFYRWHRWNTPDGQVGDLDPALYFADANGDGVWSFGEDVWVDDGDGRYNGETQVTAGGNAAGWTTAAGTPGTQGQTVGMVFADLNGNGAWNAGEDVWQNIDGNVTFDIGNFGVMPPVPADRLVTAIDGARSSTYQLNEPAGGVVYAASAVVCDEDGACSEFGVDFVVTRNATVPMPPVVDSFSPAEAEPGDQLVVVLRNPNAAAMRIHLRWMRNFDFVAEQNSGASLVAANGTHRFVLNEDLYWGDVWSFQAYCDDNLGGYSDYTARENVRVIGGQDASENGAPSNPTSVRIRPEYPNDEDLLVCVASGAVDPEGDAFDYYYFWETYDEEAGTFVTVTETVEDQEGNEFEIPVTGPVIPEDLTEADTQWVCRVVAMDVFGNQSAVVSSQVVRVAATGPIADDEYEPNDTMSQAHRVLPKDDWWDAGAEGVQEHSIGGPFDEQDWFWFLVEDTAFTDQFRVRFETNNGEEMFNQNHNSVNDGFDTTLTLYGAGGAKLGTYTDIGTYGVPGSTMYARFDRVLAPGVYYVLVTTPVYGLNMAVPYSVHLGIEPVSGPSGPAPVGEVTLSPSPATTADDLVCTVTGVESDADLRYVWLRNGQIVPMGGEQVAQPGQLDVVYELAHATTSNVLDHKYTGSNEFWQCRVYAVNDNGESLGVTSAPVAVLTAEWEGTVSVRKTFDDGTSPVAQDIVLAWAVDATNGFDVGLDEEIPTTGPPSGPGGIAGGLPSGAAYSMGLDLQHSALVRDVRPYGQATAWFIVIDLGDSPVACSIDWSTLTSPDSDMPMTISEVDDLNPFAGPVGATYSMSQVSSLAVGADEVAALKASGRPKIYRISLGGGPAEQELQLHPGWNLISLAIDPYDARPEQLFVTSGRSASAGPVWAYQNGGYVAAAQLVAGRGYWLYAPGTETVTVVVRGQTRSGGIDVQEGWNLIGPFANRDKWAHGALVGDVYFYDGVAYRAASPYNAALDKAQNADAGLGVLTGLGYWLEMAEPATLPGN